MRMAKIPAPRFVRFALYNLPRWLKTRSDWSCVFVVCWWFVLPTIRHNGYYDWKAGLSDVIVAWPFHLFVARSSRDVHCCITCWTTTLDKVAFSAKPEITSKYRAQKLFTNWMRSRIKGFLCNSSNQTTRITQSPKSCFGHVAYHVILWTRVTHPRIVCDVNFNETRRKISVDGDSQKPLMVRNC